MCGGLRSGALSGRSRRSLSAFGGQNTGFLRKNELFRENIHFLLAIERLQGIFRVPNIMAKASWIARNKRKQATVAKYADLRMKLKKEKDYVGLTMLPRDASPTRVVNRCEFSGRRRAFLRRFRLSRISFREMASAGLIPGVTKSSW